MTDSQYNEWRTDTDDATWVRLKDNGDGTYSLAVNDSALVAIMTQMATDIAAMKADIADIKTASEQTNTILNAGISVDIL